MIDWRSNPNRDISYWHKICAAGNDLRGPRKRFSSEIGLYLANEHGGINWNCGVPFGLSAPSHARFIRYIAAVTNNLVMTHGGSLLRIKSEVQDYNAIINELRNRYSQVLDILAKWYPGRKFYIVLDDGTNQTTPGRKPENCVSKPLHPSLPESLFLGIDIGNSRIKMVVLRGGEVVYMHQLPSKISELAPLGPIKYFERVAEIVKRLVAENISFDAKLAAVGIAWFGDVLEGIPLTQAADLALWAEGIWAKEIQDIKSKLDSMFDCPLIFYGDSESLARYIGIWRGLPQTYMLILGTSTGGAYFLPDGSYQSGFNLPSRMVIDLDDDAPQHSATGTPGVLQQYSASYGIARALRFHPFPHKQAFSQGSSDGAYLSSLLSSSEIEVVEYAKRCVDRLASWLIPVVVDLRTHYYFDKIVFSGGNVRPPLGPALADSLQRQWQEVGWSTLKVRLLSDETGWPPSHEIAIAAAKLAALRSPYGV